MLRVPNWERFQHYHHRRPPWIRLHRSLLDNYDYFQLPVECRAVAPLLWLLASETDDGSIPSNIMELSFRLRMAEHELVPAIEALVEAGFLERDSETLAPRKQRASNPLAPRKQNVTTEKSRVEESRVETEKREEGASAPPSSPEPAPKAATPRMSRPTVQEVKAYILEQGYQVDPVSFCDFYESKGWLVGKAPMKDWRAAVRTWARRRDQDKAPKVDNFGGKLATKEGRDGLPCAYCGGPWPCANCYPEFAGAAVPDSD